MRRWKTNSKHTPYHDAQYGDNNLKLTILLCWAMKPQPCPLHLVGRACVIPIVKSAMSIKYLIGWIFMSPLCLRRDLFITLDLNNFFSALTLNFAFLPQKLMVSHTQGFCSLCPAFVVFCQQFCSQDYKVLLTMWTIWWWCGFSLKKVITG